MKQRSVRAEHVDLYERVTKVITDQLEAGVVPWRKPWTTSERQANMLVHRNAATGHQYRGVNVLLLAGTNYPDHRWLTFKQAQGLGGTVRKGEKGTFIVFWKQLQVEDRDDPTKTKTIPMLRGITVFNVAQCDNLTFPKSLVADDKVVVVPIDAAEAIASGFADCPHIGFGGNQAFYSPSKDCIQMPLRASFESQDAFYSTLFHEMTHSTGHPSRTDRFDGNTQIGFFGSETYSKEELVAELGASFLCAMSGIEDTFPNSAAYIGHWLDVLNGDRKIIVQAAGLAQRAADHILGVKAGVKS